MASGPTNLSAFHSMGLWLAVRMMPPAARWCSTASCTVGVATKPTSITWHPTDCSPAVAAPANIGPDVRASRPTTIDGRTARRPDGLPSFAQVPNAAAHRATTSGVRSVPTRPRTPDTLTIRVSDMDDQSNGKRRRETASSEGVDRNRSYSGGGCACNRVTILLDGFARRFRSTILLDVVHALRA